MKHMGRVVSILPIEQLVVDKRVHATTNNIVRTTVFPKLCLLVLPQLCVVLHPSSLSLVITIILLKVVGYVVYRILKGLVRLIPFYWVRANLEDVNKEIHNIVILHGLSFVNSSHSKHVSVEVLYLLLREHAYLVRILHALKFLPVPCVCPCSEPNICFWVNVEVFVVILILQNLDIAIVSEPWLNFPFKLDLLQLAINLIVNKVSDNRKLLDEIIVYDMHKQRPSSTHGMFLGNRLYVLSDCLYVENIVAEELGNPVHYLIVDDDFSVPVLNNMLPIVEYVHNPQAVRVYSCLNELVCGYVICQSIEPKRIQVVHYEHHRLHIFAEVKFLVVGILGGSVV